MYNNDVGERFMKYKGALTSVKCVLPAAQERIPKHWRQPVYHAQLGFFQTPQWPVFADIVLQARTERRQDRRHA